MEELIKAGPVSVIGYLKMNYLRNEGEKFGLTEESTSDDLSRFLEAHETDLWDYPLNEVDHILEAEVPAVLVKCSDGYRWFECADYV